MLDPHAYPHIVDRILELSNRVTLLQWRCTARAFRTAAERILFHHIVVEPLLRHRSSSPFSPSRAAPTTTARAA